MSNAGQPQPNGGAQAPTTGPTTTSQPSTASSPGVKVPPPPLQPPVQAVIPPSMVIMGETGTGKTSSLATAVAAGIEVFLVGTEPNAAHAVIDRLEALKLPLDKFHWRQIIPASQGWASLIDMAQKVQLMSFEDLSKLNQGIAKRGMSHWMDLLNTFANFVDERTGLSYGDVTQWDDSRMLALDSLSGLNKMAREYVAGYKPTLHQGEWGTAMGLEEALIYKLISDRKCYFTLIAHVDRDVDEVMGGLKLTLSALGKKLAPQLVKYFGEIVLSKKEAANFYWSTSESTAAVKNRALPISDRLPQDFAQIVKAHEERKRRTMASVV